MSTSCIWPVYPSHARWDIRQASIGLSTVQAGSASWASTRRVRLGATARVVVAQAPRPVLLLQHGHAICQPVQLVYDASSGARRALATAAQLAALTGGHLMVMLVTDALESGQHLQEEVDERLQVAQVKGRYRPL